MTRRWSSASSANSQAGWNRPQTAFVAGFVGDSNRWPGRVERVADGALVVVAGQGLALRAVAPGGRLDAGQAIEIFVRPEAIAVARVGGASDGGGLDGAGLGGGANRIKGRIASVLFNGANSHLLITEAQTGSQIVAALPQAGANANLAAGEEVSLDWTAEQTACFAAVSSSGGAT